jgi:DhnA family fructose-bisphosphate aldolase class Ia
LKGEKMSDSKAHRWNRIFGKDGRTVIFAMDHAASFGMMEGLEKPGEVISKVEAGGADAILTNVGVVKKFAKEIGNMSICLRIDGGSTMMAEKRHGSQLIFSVYDALRLGAEAVCVMGMPGSSNEYETCRIWPMLSIRVWNGVSP